MMFRFPDEEKERHESLVVAVCMVGFLVTYTLVLFIIGNHHRNVRAKGARHLNNVLCVFISVNIERSHLQAFETYVIGAILNFTRVEYPSVKYAVLSCLMKSPIFMFWFLVTGRLSYFYRDSERDLALVLLLCSCLMAFTAMDMFACLQYVGAISVASAWFSMVWHWWIVFVAILLLRFVVEMEFFAAMRRLAVSQYSKPLTGTDNGSQEGIELANVGPSALVTSHHPEVASEAGPSRDLYGKLEQEEVEKPARNLSRHVRRVSQSPQSVGSLHDARRDWINGVREVEHQCSAFALGYLIAEAVEAQILDRSSKIGQFKACQSAHVTWMCVASLFIIVVQLLLRGGTPYLERIISRSEVEHLQALLSASSGWLCVTVIRMCLSLHVSHSLTLHIFLGFVSTTLLACLLIASSKVQSLCIFTSDMVEDLLSSLGMATGFFWQVTWAAGVHSIVQDGLPGEVGDGQTFVEMVVNLVVAGVLIHGWRAYALPSALEAEEHFGNGLGSTSLFPSSVPSIRRSGAQVREESRDKVSTTSPPESTHPESHSGR